MTERPSAGAGDPTAVLGADGALAPSWLRDRQLAPVPMGSAVDAPSARRLAAGCRAVGASHLVRVDPATGAAFPLDVGGAAGLTPPCLVLTPGREGALLFPGPGHAFVAGTAPFMAAAVAEGTDAARARFARYARALSDRWPRLSEVAAAHPPRHRAWAGPQDVDPASAVARMLTLIRGFARGGCPAAEFAAGWREAHRAARRDGERTVEPLTGLLDRVFMLLEDYADAPGPVEPGELDDAALRAGVAEAWRHITRASGAGTTGGRG
ncbi:hypothetical protein [Streptomyces fragilis]|uniref:Colicin D immunity protein domain-containing protein n=1 Tax=Streptomyces fragilis TaxID=67301 RepID=A0ABV2YQ19_9ACTN|nr:hypothetical protein [Streptomyces fragilis]